MTISDTHETEAPNLYGKITHTYGVVVRGYEVNIPVIPTFWIGRPLSPPTLKYIFGNWRCAKPKTAKKQITQNRHF